jgi:hypothetical protein
MPPEPPKRCTAVTDAERRQLRSWRSEHLTATIAAAATWFSSQLQRPIDKSIVSRILSSKYKHLDAEVAIGGDRKRHRVAH